MVSIPVDLAKKLWKDDEKMLDTIQGWESVRCGAEVGPDGSMELTPNGLWSDDGPGLKTMHREGGCAIGAPVTVHLGEYESDAGEEEETPLGDQVWTPRNDSEITGYIYIDGEDGIAIAKVYSDRMKRRLLALPKLVKVAKKMYEREETLRAYGFDVGSLAEALREMGELE